MICLNHHASDEQPSVHGNGSLGKDVDADKYHEDVMKMSAGMKYTLPEDCMTFSIEMENIMQSSGSVYLMPADILMTFISESSICVTCIKLDVPCNAADIISPSPIIPPAPPSNRGGQTDIEKMIQRIRASVTESQLQRRLRLYSDVDEVLPGLHLSGVAGRTLTNIRKYGFTLIVNVSVDIGVLYLTKLENLKLWVSDLPSSDIYSYFDEASAKIDKHLSKETPGQVLVHCQAGISRSTTIVLAYLIKYKKMTLLEAFKLVARARPMVRPNPGFWNQLKKYEKEITGTISVESIPTDF